MTRTTPEIVHLVKQYLPIDTVLPLTAILAMSLTLGLRGNTWGAPAFWHPDEIIGRTVEMAGRQSLNPHHFAYGGLHYYILGIGAIAPAHLYSRAVEHFAPPATPKQAEERRMARMTLMIRLSRGISAVMATAGVAVTFLIGWLLFGRPTGLLAALFLSLSMGYVAIAHFATVDLPSLFWYWLSCLFGVLMWKRGNTTWYVLAAVAAGFAIGTKLDKVFVLVPLGFSCWLGNRRLLSPRALILLIGIPISFALVNPSLFLSPFEFLDGTTRDFFFNMVRERGTHTYGLILDYLRFILGTPLFGLAIFSLAHAVFDAARGKDRTAVVWILATFMPYYLAAGSRLVTPWYIPFFCPPLMVLAGRTLATYTRDPAGLARRTAGASAAAMVAFSALFSWSIVVQFAHDSRHEARTWVTTRIPAGTLVGISDYRAPRIDPRRYRIVGWPPASGSDTFLRWRADLDRDRWYQRLRQTILQFEARAAPLLGVSRRASPYSAWFDRIGQRRMMERPPATVKPDYVILVWDFQPRRTALLLRSGSGYRVVRIFKNSASYLPSASFSFVNPAVYVFERE